MQPIPVHRNERHPQLKKHGGTAEEKFKKQQQKKSRYSFNLLQKRQVLFSLQLNLFEGCSDGGLRAGVLAKFNFNNRMR
jgi:hypothetical protein